MRQENSAPGTCPHSELYIVIFFYIYIFFIIAHCDGQIAGDCVEELGG